MSQLRVLVTGGAGYIGSVLCQHLLEAGHQVVVLDNMMYGQRSLFQYCSHPNFDFVLRDCRDEAALRRLVAKADVIIALAAIVGAPACAFDPELARSVNVDAIRLLNGMRSPDQLLIYPTTNSGYGTKSGDLLCTEETPLEPVSIYGMTKVQMEAELLQTSNVIALRLASVFGTSPRMRLGLLVNDFVYAAFKQRYIVLFEADFKRNYVHIRDVADCFLFCMEHRREMAGRVFNVGMDAADASKRELAETIKTFVPDFRIFEAPLGEDPDKRNYIVSSQRLRDAGFEPSRTLELGIAELWKAYQMIGRDEFENARFVGAELGSGGRQT